MQVPKERAGAGPSAGMQVDAVMDEEAAPGSTVPASVVAAAVAEPIEVISAEHPDRLALSGVLPKDTVIGQIYRIVIIHLDVLRRSRKSAAGAPTPWQSSVSVHPNVVTRWSIFAPFSHNVLDYRVELLLRLLVTAVCSTTHYLWQPRHQQHLERIVLSLPSPPVAGCDLMVAWGRGEDGQLGTYPVYFPPMLPTRSACVTSPTSAENRFQLTQH